MFVGIVLWSSKMWGTESSQAWEGARQENVALFLVEIGWLSKKTIFTFLISAPVKRFSFAFSINLGHLWPYCGKGRLMKNDRILQDKVKEEGEIWWTQTLGVDDQWRVAKRKAHPYVWQVRRRKSQQIHVLKENKVEATRKSERRKTWRRGFDEQEGSGEECVHKVEAEHARGFGGQWLCLWSVDSTCQLPHVFPTLLFVNIQPGKSGWSRQPENSSSLNRISVDA